MEKDEVWEALNKWADEVIRRNLTEHWYPKKDGVKTIPKPEEKPDVCFECLDGEKKNLAYRSCSNSNRDYFRCSFCPLCGRKL